MISFSPTEETIITLLAEGPSKATEMLERIRTIKTRMPKQTLYAALQRLLAASIIVKHKQVLSINKLWATQLIEFAQKLAQPNDWLLSLPEKKSLKVTFPSPYTAITFWNHTSLVLGTVTPHTIPLVYWNPHHWFLIVSEEANSERVLFENMAKQHRVLITTGSATPIDRCLKQQIEQNPLISVNLESKPTFDHTHYFDVLGDFIIETIFTESVAQDIDEWFLKYNTITEETMCELKDIVSKPSAVKMKITHNSIKATQLRKKLEKGFVIDREYK